MKQIMKMNRVMKLVNIELGSTFYASYTSNYIGTLLPVLSTQFHRVLRGIKPSTSVTHSYRQFDADFMCRLLLISITSQSLWYITHWIWFNNSLLGQKNIRPLELSHHSLIWTADFLKQYIILKEFNLSVY